MEEEQFKKKYYSILTIWMLSIMVFCVDLFCLLPTALKNYPSFHPLMLFLCLFFLLISAFILCTYQEFLLEHYDEIYYGEEQNFH